MVYLIGNLAEGIAKIGWSKAPLKRLKELQTGCPYPVEILGVMEVARSVEKRLHKEFQHYHLHGEWFNLHEDILATFPTYQTDEDEPPHILLDNNWMMRVTMGMSNSQYKVLLWLCYQMTNKTVYTKVLPHTRNLIGETCNLSRKQVDQALKDLVIHGCVTNKAGTNQYCVPYIQKLQYVTPDWSNHRAYY